MPFVTKLTFESGDREVLDRVVEDIKESAERKGVEMKGPHPRPATDLSAPQQKRLAPGDSFEAWNFQVYTRDVEIHGYDEFARRVAGDDYPASVHVSADVKQTKGLGRN
ncbi:uS10/mL48 family ribosomal protein [Halosegnis marinus]|uniref:Small ribosomal subunit protein uS10 n=1 Tax=Halosegnis marinus TaxID=3034023 RepID=A0ABD5ZR29_9EURY|nr:uS10/mL48 family ribosomal protein [Halosegnis sp. DT85]